MSRTWLTSCTRAPGPEDNLDRYPTSYGVPGGGDPYSNQMLGVVNHSAGGNFSAGNAPANVMVSRGNSWHITIFKDGRKEQHFALEAMCWGAGPKSNYKHEQIEHEGGPPGNPSEPLTALALASTIEVQSEICRIRGWPAIVLGTTGFEHNEFMYTDCPSNRIPHTAIEKGTREDDMATVKEITDLLNGMSHHQVFGKDMLLDQMKRISAAEETRAVTRHNALIGKLDHIHAHQEAQKARNEAIYVQLRKDITAIGGGGGGVSSAEVLVQARRALKLGGG